VRVLLLAFCLLVATACDDNNPTGPTVPLNERFTLAPGERVRIEDASFGLEFRGVTGDSRCPADAICIQGGDAIVHVRALDGATADYELHTGDSSRSVAVHRQTRIRLEELQPYPFSSRTIAPGDYRATLIVTRP
jgi:hypothetical protein